MTDFCGTYDRFRSASCPVFPVGTLSGFPGRHPKFCLHYISFFFFCRDRTFVRSRCFFPCPPGQRCADRSVSIRLIFRSKRFPRRAKASRPVDIPFLLVSASAPSFFTHLSVFPRQKFAPFPSGFDRQIMTDRPQKRSSI